MRMSPGPCLSVWHPLFGDADRIQHRVTNAHFELTHTKGGEADTVKRCWSCSTLKQFIETDLLELKRMRDTVTGQVGSRKPGAKSEGTEIDRFGPMAKSRSRKAFLQWPQGKMNAKYLYCTSYDIKAWSA